MLKVADWIKKLKHIEAKRATFYDNTFPGNCGLIHDGGVLSFDCIGLVKSVINDPDIATRTKPVGFYVQPGKVIPDYDEINILYLCSGVEWHKFKNIVPGEYLYMAGHGAVYVGDFSHNSTNGIVNTIECTTDMGDNGVTTTWLDVNTGNRYDHKGGTMLRGWEAHGKLTKYIDYTERKEDGSMFNDVPKDDKYYDVYKALAEAKIMGKDKEGNFRPDKKVTRKTLALVAYRIMKKAKLLK